MHMSISYSKLCLCRDVFDISWFSVQWHKESSSLIPSTLIPHWSGHLPTRPHLHQVSLSNKSYDISKRCRIDCLPLHDKEDLYLASSLCIINILKVITKCSGGSHSNRTYVLLFVSCADKCMYICIYIYIYIYINIIQEFIDIGFVSV